VVAALARNPDAVVRAEGVIPVRGDVLAAETWAARAEGCDAIIFALGSGAGGGATKVFSAGVRSAISVMASAQVRKIVAISAVPVRSAGPVGATGRHLSDGVLYRFFGETYADMKRMEEELATSGLDWTVVRPPRLTNGRGRGGYRWAIGEKLPRAGRISRADLALALLDATQRRDWARSIVTVAQ
jgi:putative NADH-flavin reductase